MSGAMYLLPLYALLFTDDSSWFWIYLLWTALWQWAVSNVYRHWQPPTR